MLVWTKAQSVRFYFISRTPQYGHLININTARSWWPVGDRVPLYWEESLRDNPSNEDDLHDFQRCNHDLMARMIPSYEFQGNPLLVPWPIGCTVVSAHPSCTSWNQIIITILCNVFHAVTFLIVSREQFSFNEVNSCPLIVWFRVRPYRFVLFFADYLLCWRSSRAQLSTCDLYMCKGAIVAKRLYYGTVS